MNYKEWSLEEYVEKFPNGLLRMIKEYDESSNLRVGISTEEVCTNCGSYWGAAPGMFDRCLDCNSTEFAWVDGIVSAAITFERMTDASLFSGDTL